MGLGKLLVFGAAAAAGAAYLQKKKKIDLKSVGQQAINAVKLNVKETEKYGNGAALTPPMGWSSWNTFGRDIDEQLILETAAAMKNSGLLEAGYNYLNIDDCWQSSMRDENGKLQSDFQRFPSGIKKLVEDVNAMGIKLGIYTSNGTLTCEDLPASLGCEGLDADTFAEWGVEYFKYDFCHNVPIPFRAPNIEKITVNKPGSAEMITVLADEGILSGGAKIVEDEKLGSGKYITGLSANGGAVEFLGINAEEDGEYILTLYIKKKSNSKKFAKLLVNSTDEYETTVPPSRAPFSGQGRHQIKIMLKKGENTIKIYNPIASRQDSASTQYRNMGRELIRATREYAEKTGKPEKPIVYSICEWGFNFPWNWGASAGNLWRTTLDIKAFWASVLAIYEVNVKLAKYAGPGGWNDPDMLEVGNGSLTYDENKSHFTLWCMMAAPLILGNDLRRFIMEDGSVDSDNEILKMVTNKELISIDQDKLGVQCRRFYTNIVSDILVKKLDGGEMALCLFNKSNDIKELEADLITIACQPYDELAIAENYEIHELWDGSTEIVRDTVKAVVPPHGVKIYRVKPAD